MHTRATMAAGTRTEHGFRKHAVADLALHVTTVDGVPTTTLERAVVDLADSRSGSPGESCSRVIIAREGFPAPELQTRFDDAAGLIGYVDFSWPAFRLIGEFDGLQKYSKAEIPGERTPAEVVTAEKVREDRLRATPTQPGVSRWIWHTVHTRGALGAQLRAAGLPSSLRPPGASG